MAKTLNSAAIDACYTYMKAQCASMSVCTTQPTTFAHANATYMLAKVALATTGLTVAAGDGGGSARKVTTQAKSGVSVTTTGTAKFVALFGSSTSAFLLVTTCTSVALTTGNTVTIPAFKHEFGDLT
jgi:hypothetical protein